MGACHFCKSLLSLAKVSWEMAGITKTNVFMGFTGHRQGLDRQSLGSQHRHLEHRGNRLNLILFEESSCHYVSSVVGGIDGDR